MDDRTNRYPAAMGKADWGTDPKFFGPRHAHRERRIVRELRRRVPSPGKHLECAAGVGSLAVALAQRGFEVVAADRSLRSLAEVRRRTAASTRPASVLPVVAAIERLPFADAAFTSATSAETLEHVEDDRGAVRELSRVLAADSWLVGTVPAGPDRWSDWDDWAGHLRRYTPATLGEAVGEAGGEVSIRRWGWPLLAVYDRLFLTPINRRRLRSSHGMAADPVLRRVAKLGRSPVMVRSLSCLFDLDRVFDGLPWGVELLFAVRRS